MSTDATHQWLTDLYGSSALDGLGLTLCHRTGSGRLGFEHRPVRDLEGTARRLVELSDSTCTWLGCCPLNRRPDSGRGGAGDTGALVGVWADVDVAGPGHRHDGDLPLPADVDTARQLLHDIGLPPTKVLHTGGGLQAWWLLAEPWRFDDDADRAEAGALSQGFGDTLVEFGRRRNMHVDHVGDLARILRPAGTWNRKPGRAPAPVSVLVDDGPRHLLADIDDVLLAPTEPATSVAKPANRSTGATPADVFGRHVTWAELLEPHGWRRFTHANGTPADGSPCPTCGARVELWSHRAVELDRRGRPSHVSATACHVLFVFSSNPAVHPLPTRRPCTPFRAWALLDHGGDLRAAARRLVTTIRTLAGAA